MPARDPLLAALGHSSAAAAYVPRLLPAWAAAEPGVAHRVVDGTLLLFDITGFTPLTERLARRGREGAEELSNLLDSVFGRLLMDAEHEGADLLKWSGDALLLHSRRRRTLGHAGEDRVGNRMGVVGSDGDAPSESTCPRGHLIEAPQISIRHGTQLCCLAWCRGGRGLGQRSGASAGG